MINLNYNDVILAESDPINSSKVKVEDQIEMQPIREESGSKRDVMRESGRDECMSGEDKQLKEESIVERIEENLD